jgi:four helix bundle protein
MLNSGKRYNDLNVWLEARRLFKDIYSTTAGFPKEEQFGLTNQMRRSAISIPSNIAEGCGRNYPKDSIQFFYIARGSIYELETQLYLSFDLDYIEEVKLNQLLTLTEITRKLLSGFIKYYQQIK